MADAQIHASQKHWFERQGPPRTIVTDDLKGLPDLWTQCSGCQRVQTHERMQAALWVCPSCHTHLRMPAAERIQNLADPGSAWLWPDNLVAQDKLGFMDERSYASRLEQTRASTGRNDAIHAATITLGGRRAELAVMDFAFMGGSMGAVVGEQLTRTIERGIQRKVPVIIVCASGGARMQEGVLSLMQMAKVSAALAELRDRAKQPYFSVLTHPTTGGVAASFAMLGDVILAEPGALIGFAGPRVIKQTIGAELPPGFQRAEFLEAHGMVDRIVPRARLRQELSFLLACFSAR